MTELRIENITPERVETFQVTGEVFDADPVEGICPASITVDYWRRDAGEWKLGSCVVRGLRYLKGGAIGKRYGAVEYHRYNPIEKAPPWVQDFVKEYAQE